MLVFNVCLLCSPFVSYQCSIFVGAPICDKPSSFQPPPSSTISISVSHEYFVIVVVMAILSSVVLYIIIFLALQYRSHGRCLWRTYSSTLFVDGGGIIEYSSLTDKDVDMPLEESNGYKHHSLYGGNGTNGTLNHDSD